MYSTKDIENLEIRKNTAIFAEKNNCAYEFKWNDKRGGTKCPESFAIAYPNAQFKVITPANIETFLIGK